MTTLLQINATANWGSTGKIAEQIGEKALSRGWDSYLAFGRKSTDSRLNLIHVGDKLGVLYHFFCHRFLDREGLASRLATRYLISRIKRINPDIIHLHNIHDHWINYPILFSYLGSISIPIVWTFHDCWAFTGHCAHFITHDCDKWRSRCFHCPSAKYLDRSSQNYLLKEKYFTAIKDLHIVVVSEWLGNCVRKSFFRDKDIHVIYNGVDLSVFTPFASSLPYCFKLGKKHTLLGVATSWSNTKGLSDYIELSKRLRDDIQIVLVGLNKNQVASIPKTIVAIPRTRNQSELRDLYVNADIVLSLSKAESFGLTIAEGLACGTPGIVYDNTAQPELISSETGVIVKTGDINALIDAIYHLLDYPLSPLACRKRAELYFNKDHSFDKYIDLYNALLQNHCS